MADKAPNLYDAYIIDGIPQALTPAGLLQECTLPGALPPQQPAGSAADETVDISPTPFDFRDEDIDAYADAVAALPRPPFPLPFAGQVVELLPVDLHSRVHGWDLLDRPPKAGQHSLQLLQTYVN